MRQTLFLIIIALSFAITSPSAAVQKPTVGDVFRYMRVKIDSTGKLIEGTRTTMELVVMSKDGFRDGRRNLYLYRYDGNPADYFIDVEDNGNVATYETLLAWNFWQIYPCGTKTTVTCLERDTVNGKGVHFHVKAVSSYVGDETLTTAAGSINTQKIKIVYTVSVTGDKKEYLGEQLETHYYWFAPRSEERRVGKEC